MRSRLVCLSLDIYICVRACVCARARAKKIKKENICNREIGAFIFMPCILRGYEKMRANLSIDNFRGYMYGGM